MVYKRRDTLTSGRWTALGELGRDIQDLLAIVEPFGIELATTAQRTIGPQIPMTRDDECAILLGILDILTSGAMGFLPVLYLHTWRGSVAVSADCLDKLASLDHARDFALIEQLLYNMTRDRFFRN